MSIHTSKYGQLVFSSELFIPYHRKNCETKTRISSDRTFVPHYTTRNRIHRLEKNLTCRRCQYDQRLGGANRKKKLSTVTSGVSLVDFAHPVQSLLTFAHSILSLYRALTFLRGLKERKTSNSKREREEKTRRGNYSWGALDGCPLRQLVAAYR